MWWCWCCCCTRAISNHLTAHWRPYRTASTDTSLAPRVTTQNPEPGIRGGEESVWLNFDLCIVSQDRHTLSCIGWNTIVVFIYTFCAFFLYGGFQLPFSLSVVRYSFLKSLSPAPSPFPVHRPHPPTTAHHNPIPIPNIALCNSRVL